VRTTVHGDLADEISICVADVRGGEGFLSALRRVSDRSPSLSVSRFVDGVAVATERGTPMADVLRSQAADARAAGHRQLMEGASKREVLMLTPVVFLVLPIVVVIALYPGIHGLSFAIP
jgi:tight adherence protein C